MTTALIAVAAAVVVLLLAIVVTVLRRRATSRRLQQQFGDEYAHALRSEGGRRDAEHELRERTQRREDLHVVELDPSTRDEYSQRWRRTQEAFVDAPALAVQQADLLIAQVMADRGYPTGDFEQQARDVSVDHGSVVTEYRTAHQISLLNDRNRASTEQLREAMTHYRRLFTDLLEVTADQPMSDRRN